jgi:hypothetical protein
LPGQALTSYPTSPAFLLLVDVQAPGFILPTVIELPFVTAFPPPTNGLLKRINSAWGLKNNPHQVKVWHGLLIYRCFAYEAVYSVCTVSPSLDTGANIWSLFLLSKYLKM